MGLQSKTEPVWVSCGSNFQIYIYIYNTSVVAHRRFFKRKTMQLCPAGCGRILSFKDSRALLHGSNGYQEDKEGQKKVMGGNPVEVQPEIRKMQIPFFILWGLTCLVVCKHDNA